MSLGYDDELPAGYQDADLEMLELAAMADEADRPCSACGVLTEDAGPFPLLCGVCKAVAEDGPEG